MKVQAVGRASYLITVTREELETVGISPDLTCAEAVRLIGMAIPDGAKPMGRAFFEVYPGRDELMIFVRTGGSASEAYRFSEFEDLLAAVRLCPDMFRSELFWDGEGYILILTPWDGGGVPCRMGEFGRRLHIGEDMLPHIREQLRCVIPCGAVRQLRRAF